MRAGRGDAPKWSKGVLGHTVVAGTRSLREHRRVISSMRSKKFVVSEPFAMADFNLLRSLLITQYKNLPHVHLL